MSYKGTTWKKHIYVSKNSKGYIYPNWYRGELKRKKREEEYYKTHKYAEIRKRYKDSVIGKINTAILNLTKEKLNIKNVKATSAISHPIKTNYYDTWYSGSNAVERALRKSHLMIVNAQLKKTDPTYFYTHYGKGS